MSIRREIAQAERSSPPSSGWLCNVKLSDLSRTCVRLYPLPRACLSHRTCLYIFITNPSWLSPCGSQWNVLPVL